MNLPGPVPARNLWAAAGAGGSAKFPRKWSNIAEKWVFFGRSNIT
jgi:hypothetical protein